MNLSATKLVASPERPRRALESAPCGIALPLFCGSLLFYIATLSKAYSGEGLRYLSDVTGRQIPKPAGASHALFPLLAWTWNRVGEAVNAHHFLGAVGVEFPNVVWLQALSAIAGALGVSLFYLILRECGLSVSLAAAVSICMGCADAYWTAATDMAEPMASVPLMLAGLLCAVRTRLRGWGALPAIILVAAGGAIYELALSSTIVLAGIAWGASRQRLVTALGICFAVALTFSLFVVSVTVLTGRGDLSAVHQLILPETARGLFGHLEPRHLVGSLFGMASAFVALQEWSGASNLLLAPWPAVAHNLVVLTVVLVFFGNIGMLAWHHRDSGIQRTAAIWSLAIWLFAAFWAATYFKIWLFGVVSLALWAGNVLVRAWSSVSPSRRMALLALACSSLGVGIATGTRLRVLTDTPDLVRARGIAKRICASDLLVSTGLDLPSVYLKTLVRPTQHMLSLTDSAIALGSGPATFALLAQQVKETDASGHKVFFLSLLAMSPRQWNEFFGARLGLDFGGLAPFRALIEESDWIPPGQIYRLDRIGRNGREPNSDE